MAAVPQIYLKITQIEDEDSKDLYEEMCVHMRDIIELRTRPRLQGIYTALDFGGIEDIPLRLLKNAHKSTRLRVLLVCWGSPARRREL